MNCHKSEKLQTLEMDKSTQRPVETYLDEKERGDLYERINKAGEYWPLLLAILWRACLDLKRPERPEAVEAALWLAGPGPSWILDALGLDGSYLAKALRNSRSADGRQVKFY